jgi:23S rRNA (adenine2030-N6)-methyltransferase
MNYRHIYHAGNFADVVKHIVLVRIIMHLQRKDKAFRVVDTHAGLGLYDLASDEAQKTGEWLLGIGKLLNAQIPGKIAPLVQPYLDLMQSLDGGITAYPGSPLIARKLLRKQDRLSLCELHHEDVGVLRELFAGDYQVRVNELDGWLALGGHLPPKEKRGMVLVDPPFEQPDEFDRLVEGLAKAHKRWSGGTYCLWYPVKNQRNSDGFASRIQELGIAKTLRAELYIQRPDHDDGLNGCGLIIVNPPYTLEEELRLILPWLAGLLSQGKGAGSCLEWLTGE